MSVSCFKHTFRTIGRISGKSWFNRVECWRTLLLSRPKLYPIQSALKSKRRTKTAKNWRFSPFKVTFLANTAVTRKSSYGVPILVCQHLSNEPTVVLQLALIAKIAAKYTDPGYTQRSCLLWLTRCAQIFVVSLSLDLALRAPSRFLGTGASRWTQKTGCRAVFYSCLLYNAYLVMGDVWMWCIRWKAA